MAEVKGKELRVDISGNADKLGEEAKKAEQYIKNLKTAGLDALTGGLYTGGAFALVEKTIGAIKLIIEDIREVIRRAEQLNVDRQGAANIEGVGLISGLGVPGADAAVEQLRRLRSDAFAGDDQAVKAFADLGITLGEIERLAPDRLFRRVLEATRGMDLNAERFYAVSKLIGQEAATKILPYTTGPGADKFFMAANTVGAIKGNWLTRGWSWAPDMAGVGPVNAARLALAGDRRPFEPFSAFGIQNKEQADFAAEQNRQRLLAVGRTQLSTEERINEVIGERLRLIRIIEDEQDPVKRQKFIADAIAVEAELAGLVNRRAGELGTQRGTQTSDPLRAVGADFSRFAPNLGTEIGKQQLNELRTLRQTLDTGLRRLETAVDRSIGPGTGL